MILARLFITAVTGMMVVGMLWSLLACRGEPTQNLDEMSRLIQEKSLPTAGKILDSTDPKISPSGTGTFTWELDPGIPWGDYRVWACRRFADYVCTTPADGELNIFRVSSATQEFFELRLRRVDAARVTATFRVTSPS